MSVRHLSYNSYTTILRKCRRLEDGKEFAVKIVSQRFAFHALREIRMLELVNPHKNIVKFEEALHDPLHYYLGKIY